MQNGGSIYISSLGWAWESYGEGKNKNLVYELNFASHVIASQFGAYLDRDSFALPTPYIFEHKID